MEFLVLCDFFVQIHLTSLNFSLQIGLWAKKCSVFVFVSILMTMSYIYMSLEIFSFEWIQILNGTKVWQYHRLSHHKIWASSIHIWFFIFHTITLYWKVNKYTNRWRNWSLPFTSKRAAERHLLSHSVCYQAYRWSLHNVLLFYAAKKIC